MPSENNNTSVILVSGIVLSFLLIIFLLNNKRMIQPQINQEPQYVQPQLGQPEPIQTQPKEPIFQKPFVCEPYPHCYPEYHSNTIFWEGYHDGWKGFGPRSEGRIYLQGYEIGKHDRRCNHAYYHEHYYPPSLHLRLPGLNINVR